METLLREVVEKFNARVKSDAELREALKGIERQIQLEISDGKWYWFRLKDGLISEFAEGRAEQPEVRIISDTATLTALLKKELRPMKAIALKKIRIKASLSDMLMLKKFLG